MKFRILSATLVALSLFFPLRTLSAAPDTKQVMLQGSSTAAITDLVKGFGGTITHDLHVINAVGAKLTQSQLDRVLKSPLITRHIDDLAATDAPREKPKKEEENCKVRGHIELDIDPQQIRWPLYNKFPETALLESLSLKWPTSMGTVKELSLGDIKVDAKLYSSASHGSLRVNFPSSARPTIKDKATLIVKFQSATLNSTELPLRQSDFEIEASFVGDCSTDLVPGYENNHEDFYYNTVAGVDALHHQGITGKGVTVAVVDSGLWEHEALQNDTTGKNRLIARYNAITNTSNEEAVDESGHGTHMTSIIAHSGPTSQNGRKTGTYKGVAPDVNLVAVKVLDRAGLAHLLDIVRAIQWVVDHRRAYGIRVLNLSFAQLPRWPYWEDPVNQAVMKAWADGITVVAAAGNEGPDPMTIGSPGNLPYIITVGAVTDSWTPNTRDDDYVPDFSSRGPTPSGHLKPDIVALGGHMTGLIRPDSALALEQPEDILKSGEFVSTGSSQASALVSGIIALLLQLDPGLSPDDLKCKLISSAEPAINRDGLLAYSPFQQGYGSVNATRAVTLGQNECGEPKLDFQADIEDKRPFYGPAIIGDNGNATLPGLNHMVSPAPSDKGLSEIRKWGVKDHIERSDFSAPDTAPAQKPAFDWQELYMLEKNAIEHLTQPPQ
jgi:serine protease AprX